MFRKISPKNFALVTGFAAASLILTSCGGGEEGAGTGTSADYEVTTDTIKAEVRINFDQLRVNIPTPSKLAAKLTAAKINYNKSFLLSPSRGGSFSSNYQKAIGMGALGSDLNVAAAYNQSSDAVEYLGQVGKLATDLGIGTAFDPEFSKELIQNVSKPDTFSIMLDKAFDKAERNLRSNQRVALAILMVTGGWVEALHVSVEGLSTNPNGPNVMPLYADISNHCYAFEYIFELLDAYKSNADCAKLAAELAPFKDKLNSIAKNNKLNAADLPAVRETTTALRNKVIG